MSRDGGRENLVLKGKHGKEFLADVVLPSSVGPHPVIIFSHGFKGFKDWGPFNEIADYFASKGYIFIKFNFGFNGTTLQNPYDFEDLEAFGNNNFTKELDDLDTVTDWITTHAETYNADLSRLFLIGHSRGGGISILKGYEDSRIRSVVAWATVAEFARHVSHDEILHWKKEGVLFVENTRTQQMMPLYIQLYHDYVKNHKRLNIRNAVVNYPKPLLLAHSSDDDTVPYSHAMELLDLNRDKIRLITIIGGGHTFGAAHPHELSGLPVHFEQVVKQTEAFLNSIT